MSLGKVHLFLAPINFSEWMVPGIHITKSNMIYLLGFVTTEHLIQFSNFVHKKLIFHFLDKLSNIHPEISISSTVKDHQEVKDGW